LLCSQTGSLGAGGKTLHKLLEGFASNKFDRPGSPDSDLLASLGIYSSARLARRDLESSKSDQLHTLRLFDARLDAVDHGVHRAFSFSFVSSECFLDRGDEFDFVHFVKGIGP
jgi:hypothetical protein